MQYVQRTQNPRIAIAVLDEGLDMDVVYLLIIYFD